MDQNERTILASTEIYFSFWARFVMCLEKHVRMCEHDSDDLELQRILLEEVARAVCGDVCACLKILDQVTERLID